MVAVIGYGQFKATAAFGQLQLLQEAMSASRRKVLYTVARETLSFC